MEIEKLYGTSSSLLFKEENVLYYRPGGYHPVVLGDTLKNGRYRVCHKLGYGGFSTVWAARDGELQKWVSVKIIAANMTDKSRELPTLQTLALMSMKKDVGSEHIVQLLDDFLHEGPNGCHQCLVFELLGPTVNLIVSDYDGGEDRLDSDDILGTSTQLLQAIDFIHKTGYVHGDLSTRNLAYTSKRLPHLSEEDLFKALGLPISEKIIRSDGKPLGEGVPTQLTKSTEWTGWPLDDDSDASIDELNENIRLIDFGESFPQTATPERLAQPSGLQAPETIFTNKFDYRLDLWRAGLIIYHLTFARLPFHWFKIDYLVSSMTKFVGEDLPQEWRLKWEQLRRDAGGQDLILWRNGEPSEIDQMFDTHIHEQELKILRSVIKGLTSFLPSDRISASEALDMIRSHQLVDNTQPEEAPDSSGSDS